MKIILGIFLIFIISSNVRADVITMRSDLWCPYACDPKSDRPGFMVEIAREVFQKHGHTIDYSLMNWARAIADVRAGKFDALLGCSKGDAKGFIFPKVPTGIMSNHYFVLENNPWVYSGPLSLKNKSIGIINEYSYGDVVDEQVKKKNPALKAVSGTDPLSRLIQMTETKRLDGFIENPLVLEYNLSLMKKDKKIFKASGPNLANDPDLFISFAPGLPKSKEYARILDEGMIELRKNGRLKVILSRYGLEDWKK